MLPFLIFVVLSAANTVLCEEYEYTETVQYLDYGFDAGENISLYAIELHSNAAPEGMEQAGLAYSFLIHPNGTRIRYVPSGKIVEPYDYSSFAVSYHDAEGVPPGSDVIERMNYGSLGIGFSYGLDGTATNDQLLSAAELIIGVKRLHPRICLVAGQYVFAGYRSNGMLLCNDDGCRINQGGVMVNPWNFPLRQLQKYLNGKGRRYDIHWDFMFGFNRIYGDRWQAEFLSDTPAPWGYAIIPET